MSLTYVTKEKYNKYVDIIDELEMLHEIKDKLKEKFQEIFDFDPTKNTYNAEKYKQNRQYHLDKSNGQRACSESQIKASNKYKERNREELNRKERERYHKKKELLKKQSSHVELTAFA